MLQTILDVFSEKVIEEHENEWLANRPSTGKVRASRSQIEL